MKPLEEMSLEELWELFPISLVPYNPEWEEWAQEEIHLIQNILRDYQPTIHHIGSTAVPGICAKPIIDILVEVPDLSHFEDIRNIMINSGYICMAESSSRMSFNKGYTPAGYAPKVYHIHLRLNGDNREIYFRDYLRSHPDVAKEYETLKQSLLPRFRNDRDAYTEAKSDFVNRITLLALNSAT